MWLVKTTFNIQQMQTYEFWSSYATQSVYDVVCEYGLEPCSLIHEKSFYVRIGLNESQDRNCSSKQIQLPKAVFREGNERVVCSGLLTI